MKVIIILMSKFATFTVTVAALFENTNLNKAFTNKKQNIIFIELNIEAMNIILTLYHFVADRFIAKCRGS